MDIRDVRSGESEIISHITLEQRLSYIKQQNRSRAVMAVQKWGVRRSYATSALNVAEVIKNTTIYKGITSTGQGQYLAEIDVRKAGPNYG